jgi:hypothetical protein
MVPPILPVFLPAPVPKSPLERHRPLAPTAALKVSPLCLGGMNFGDAWTPVMGECRKETVFEILDFFFEQGGNFLDTFVSPPPCRGDWLIGQRKQLPG